MKKKKTKSKKRTVTKRNPPKQIQPQQTQKIKVSEAGYDDDTNIVFIRGTNIAGQNLELIFLRDEFIQCMHNLGVVGEITTEHIHVFCKEVTGKEINHRFGSNKK